MASQSLPMGYGSQNNIPLDADDLIRVLSSNTGPQEPDKSHTILVYFARGNAKGGDEAKLNKLNVPTNTYIAHVVDVQPMFKQEFPEFDFGKTGNWLHNLEEVADLIGIPFITQSMLKLGSSETNDPAFTDAPMRHNAAGDVLLTLIALIELLRFKGFDFASMGEWTIMAFDFEGGSNYASGTTEAGIAQIKIKDLRNFPLFGSYRSQIRVDHAVVWDAIDHYLPPKCEENMGLDRKDPSTHPRFNYRCGPNGSQQKEIVLKDRKSNLKAYTLSKDSVVIRHRGLGQWLLNRIPARPAAYEITSPPSVTKVPQHLRKLGNFDSEALDTHYELMGYIKETVLDPGSF